MGQELGPGPGGGFRRLRSNGWTCSLGRALNLHAGYGSLKSGVGGEAREETIPGIREKDGLGWGVGVELRNGRE